MSEHREALEQISYLCGQGRTYTRRQQSINNIAMKALGMTANQRHEKHMEIMDRVGDDPIRDAYLARREKALARHAAYVAEFGEEAPCKKLTEMTEEDHLKAQLRRLHESYARSAKPIIDRLVAIDAIKPPAPVIFNTADLSPEVLAKSLATMAAPTNTTGE